MYLPFFFWLVKSIVWVVVLKQVTGLSKFLTAESNPDYDPEIQHEEEVGLSVVPQFPSHFGYAFNRSNLEQSPVKQPPPAKEGIPEMGPYTVRPNCVFASDPWTFCLK